MKAIRVVMADDHALVRSGIRSLLEALSGIEVVGEAGDGHEALDLIRRLHPDIAMVDVTMPGLNGLEVTERVAREHPGTRVIVLSMHATEEYVLRALRVGASAYVLKDADPEELERALWAVSRGETYLPPAMSTLLVADYRRRLAETPEPAGPLTPRQREVLQLIAEGHGTKQIAKRLTLSVKTIETHRAQLMARLDIHDVAGLVRYAIRAGLVSPGD